MIPRLLLLLIATAFCTPAPVSNDWKATIKEYDVPTPNSRPHDPEVATDGALWYTGQVANKVNKVAIAEVTR